MLNQGYFVGLCVGEEVSRGDKGGVFNGALLVQKILDNLLFLVVELVEWG